MKPHQPTNSEASGMIFAFSVTHIFQLAIWHSIGAKNSNGGGDFGNN